MLKSELNKLEKYIEELPEDLAARVKEECNRLKEIWVHELFRKVSEDVLIRYVQFHQAGIILLSDATGGLPEVQQELEQLIVFLKQSFYKYFDLDHRVTAYFLRQVRGGVDEFLLNGETRSKPVYLERSLVDCIYTSVKDMARADITYRQADQLLHFIALVGEHLQIYSSTTTPELANLLYRVNFNSTPFLHWFQDKLEKEMGEITGEVDSWVDQKVAELEDLRPARPFNAENVSIDQAVLTWLHLQKKEAIPVVDLSGQLGLNFSVAQFALFIRLFQVTGCFRENNLAKIQRFFSANFTTKKQLHISLKSFARSFYSADQSTAAVVRDALKRMIGYIDKHYFPQ